MGFKDTSLVGQYVRLEPLSASHLKGMAAAIKDGALHRLTVTSVPHPDELDGFYQNAMQERKAQQSLVYASVDAATGQVVGSTRFMNTEWAHRRTEIGFTFIAASRQRTAINTEAKLMMLTHAFEELGNNRVALRTDVLNNRSRTAIERLGAQFEGTLRNHMVMPDGRIRDTAVYSIIKNQWPEIQALLKDKLENHKP